MINKIREVFQLTEKGARGLVKASITSFFLYCAYILPMFILMFFIRDILNGNLNTAVFYTLIIIITMIVMFIVIYINYNTLYTETYRESKNLRIDIANILRALPLSYFSKHDLADLSQTIMKDVENIEHALAHAIPQAIGMFIFLIFISIGMLVNNFKMGLCIVVPLVVSLLLLFFSKKMQVNESSKYYYQLRENSDSFQEAIELQQEIKSYGQVERLSKELKDQMDKSELINIKSEKKQAIPLQASNAILKFALGLTILIGSIEYMNGELSLLFLLGYILGAAKIIFSIDVIYENIGEILFIDSRLNRIRELRNADVQLGRSVELEKYDIELNKVNFSYDKNVKVINGVSFIAKQGEVTALVGPSGCGKTSILRLMSRLYDYDSGEILIDGQDIKTVNTDNLFDKVSIVFQDVMLFNTSVRENIRIGNPNASDEEVEQAARYANCEEFIEKLADGYDSLIGENGSNLSGGERQRLSIARAILKDSPIILLDEISASLDVENEMKIQNSLNRLIKGKTVVIISHRLKSIEKVDKIVVMNEGMVESIGVHEELLKTSPTYKNMIEKSNISDAYLY